MQIAIIGAGKMGGIYAKKLQTLAPAHALGTIHSFDSNPDKKIGGAQTADSLQEILDNKDIGAVIIAASTDAHFDLAKQCLEHGKHVLLEKPVSLKAEDAQQLVSLAADRYCVLQACHQLVLNKQFKAILDAIARRSPPYSISEISAFRHYPTASEKLPSQPPLASNEGAHALSVVLEALRATGQLGDMHIESCDIKNCHNEKNFVAAQMRSETKTKPAVKVNVDLSEDAALPARKTGIKITLKGVGSETATIFWNEAEGKVEVSSADDTFNSLAGVPPDTDPLSTLVETFVRSVRDKSQMASHPGLAGNTAAAITAIHQGLEEVAKTSHTPPAISCAADGRSKC